MDRTIEEIWAEWQELERQRDSATDDDTRQELDAQILNLREEHGAALEERERRADELASRSHVPEGEDAEGAGEGQ
jgi:hypothetical protein